MSPMDDFTREFPLINWIDSTVIATKKISRSFLTENKPISICPGGGVFEWLVKSSLISADFTM